MRCLALERSRAGGLLAPRQCGLDSKRRGLGLNARNASTSGVRGGLGHGHAHTYTAPSRAFLTLVTRRRCFHVSPKAVSKQSGWSTEPESLRTGERADWV